MGEIRLHLGLDCELEHMNKIQLAVAWFTQTNRKFSANDLRNLKLQKRKKIFEMLTTVYLTNYCISRSIVF